MGHTFKELKSKTLAELKDIAKDIEHEAVQGYTQLNKEHLLKAICTALGIDGFEHHVAQGIEKGKIKLEIKELRKNRDQAIEAKNHVELASVRKKIKNLKRTLRRATV